MFYRYEFSQKSLCRKGTNEANIGFSNNWSALDLLALAYNCPAQATTKSYPLEQMAMCCVCIMLQSYKKNVYKVTCLNYLDNRFMKLLRNWSFLSIQPSSSIFVCGKRYGTFRKKTNKLTTQQLLKNYESLRKILKVFYVLICLE